MSDYVETDIGFIPKEWNVVSVGYLVDKGVLEKPLDGNHGGKHPKGSDFVKNGIPFIMATDINNGKIDFENCKFIAKELADSLDKGFSIDGDILLTHKASIGRTAIVGNIKSSYIMLTPQVTYYRIKKKDELSNVYLKYYFDSPPFQDTLLNHSDSGSTRAYVGITAQRDLPILLPPLPEQHAIAAVLSSLDEKIDLLHRQNKTLESMAETLFRQWFVEEADEGWEEGKVLDYCTHHKEGIKPQDSPAKTFSHYSIPAFDNNMNPVIENGSEIQSNKYAVVPNCLLFSKLNPNKDKRIWLILDLPSENPVCSTEFQVVLPKNRKYLFFIYSWLSIPQNYNEIASGVGGTSGSHQRIDPADIFNYPCPRIDESFIELFNWKVEPILLNISKHRIQIRTLEKLRDTLLPKLMSGEVRVDI